MIDNEFVLEAKFANVASGKHVVRIWSIDDNALLTRIDVKPRPKAD